MNDPNAPHTADPFEDLLDNLDPGDPFADEVERLLNGKGGPVPVDEDEIQAAVASLQHQIQGIRKAETRRRPRWRWTALAAAATLAVTAWGLRPGPEAALDVPATSMAYDTRTVGVRPGSGIQWQGDTVVLNEGVVSISHHAGDAPSVHRVRLAELDVLVEPVGTVYYAGSRDQIAAVWVSEGRVRLLHDRQGHLGEVGEGGWAILTPHADGSGIEVHRVADGPFDPADLGLGDDASQLLADMRWLALPSETRTGILGDDR